MSLVIWAAMQLLQLTGPDMQVIVVNPASIVAIRAPRRTDHFAPGTQCLVFTADAKHLAVRETCLEIEGQLQNHKQK